MAVAVKYIYIGKDKFDDDNPQHIDIWSLSSSMTMMHIVPNVLLASLISVHQSRYTARRFLEQLEAHVADHLKTDWSAAAAPPRAGSPPTHIERMLDWLRRPIAPGSVPNWRPDRRRGGRRRDAILMVPSLAAAVALPRRHPLRADAVASFLATAGWRWLDVTAVVVTATGSAGAVWLAAEVPPRGLNCRAVVKLVMLAIYVAKYLAQRLLNWLLCGSRSTTDSCGKMLLSALLDICSVVLFATVIFTTQIGILNRTGCYRQCLGGGPDECAIYPPKATWGVVQEGLQHLYPAILFGFLGMQLVICVVLICIFCSARKVFLQDDKPLPAEEDWEPPPHHQAENRVDRVEEQRN